MIKNVNVEQTKIERLRLVIGSISAVAGAFALTIIGAMYGYQNTVVWAVGLLLLVGGAAVAKSTALAQFLNNILRF